jgi:hypothetical protein
VIFRVYSKNQKKFEIFFKKLLQFQKKCDIITELHNVKKILIIDASVCKEVKSWQSAVFVEKALFSVRMFLTLTVRPTELGSPISVR